MTCFWQVQAAATVHSSVYSLTLKEYVLNNLRKLIGQVLVHDFVLLHLYMPPKNSRCTPSSKYKSAKPVVVLFCCACAILILTRVLAAEQRVTNVANHVIGLFGTAVLRLFDR